MKLFGKVCLLTLIALMFIGSIIGIQLLSWYGPEWVMVTTGDNGIVCTKMLSPLIWAPGILFMSILVIQFFNVWETK